MSFPANERAGISHVKSAPDLQRLLERIADIEHIGRLEGLDEATIRKSIDRLQALLDTEPVRTTQDGEPPKTEDEPINIGHSLREILTIAKQYGVIS